MILLLPIQQKMGWAGIMIVPSIRGLLGKSNFDILPVKCDSQADRIRSLQSFHFHLNYSAGQMT